MVVVLLVFVSVAISERVLTKLATSQENYLHGLAAGYLNALVASVTPSVLREDNWEVFDAIERMKPAFANLPPLETVVTNRQAVIIASSNPGIRKTLAPLAEEFRNRFPDEGVAFDDVLRHGYVKQAISYQGLQIGAAYAVFDITPLLFERRQVLVTLLLTNALVTALLALIGFVTVQRMVGPMRILETHMNDAASGNATPVSETEVSGASREAAKLFRAYNALVNSEQERQTLANRLAKEERLASFGRLASGMAHEINNPLGGLINATDTLRKHGADERVRLRSIELIQRGLQGIRDVVQAALATYRPERLARPIAAMDFEDLRILLRPELRRKAQMLEIAIEENAFSRNAPAAGPVRQAVLNLLLNACAASPAGGRIRVEAKRSDGRLELSVSDHGPGMPPGSADILTAPVVAFRPLDTGGMGLWVVRQISDEYGASISVARELPSGTTVRIVFPQFVSEVSNAA
jgi:signal transduction histidine kinase